jgi:hypothetical protein
METLSMYLNEQLEILILSFFVYAKKKYDTYSSEIRILNFHIFRKEERVLRRSSVIG